MASTRQPERSEVVMPSSRPATARWQFISNGYNKYWYLRSVLRWTTLVMAAVTLIVFAAIWSNLVTNLELRTYANGFTVGFYIAAPLLSFVVSVCAVTLLFLVRKGVTINPGWMLSADIIVGCLLAIHLSFNGLDFDTWRPHYRNPMKLISVAWGFNLAVGFLHLFSFFLDIWEVNTFRGMSREQRQRGKLGDLEDGTSDHELEIVAPNNKQKGAALRGEQQEDRPTLSNTASQADGSVVRSGSMSTTTPLRAEVADTARIEMPGTLRVELPDGRILELPEGCRVELPAQHRVELPGSSLKLDTSRPSELDSVSPSSSRAPWDRSPVSISSRKA